MKKMEWDRLPDILTGMDGTKVTDRETWEKKRRPEIVDFFPGRYMERFLPVRRNCLFPSHSMTKMR